MSQYSALMVMEEGVWPRPDAQVLEARERPLPTFAWKRGPEGSALADEVENQGYIHYNKGSVVLYCLRDFVGENSLNTAFRNLGGHLRLRRAALPHRARHVPRS
jgi:ABC-2 type transport system permease protein